MKAVIFAAGKGTRMGDLSNTTPKPMLKVSDKTLIEHKIDRMPSEIDEVILVIGHLKEKVKEYFGDAYKGRKITYVEQPEALGTAHSLFMCKPLLENEERFLVMNGDDIYMAKDMAEAIRHDHSILISPTDSVAGKAKVFFDENDNIIEIREKMQTEEPGHINTGLYSLTPKIFDYPMVTLPNGEFGLPQTMMTMRGDVPIKALKADSWIQITAPEDLEKAAFMLEELKQKGIVFLALF